MGLRDRLRDIFVGSLGLDTAADVESLRYRDIPQWDSLGHMGLVAAIEREFDIQLDTDQVIDLSSFEAAEAMLRKFGVDP
jgi:acyl carrier protein